MTPLHLAVQSGSAESVKILLGFGADVSLRNQAKQTPLALARAANDSKIAELLTGAGATK
jgi:ankyrin repeat protein